MIDLVKFMWFYNGSTFWAMDEAKAKRTYYGLKLFSIFSVTLLIYFALPTTRILLSFAVPFPFYFLPDVVTSPEDICV